MKEFIIIGNGSYARMKKRYIDLLKSYGVKEKNRRRSPQRAWLYAAV